MNTHILAIDQGTTSSRAILFRADCTIAAVAQREFPQHYPASGWVEHEPEDLWQSVLATCRAAIAKAGIAARDIAAIGIANQRETTLIWERASGRPIHRAIVWQDRRTAEMCRSLKDKGYEALVAKRTGLLLDPYFSASKIAWLLDSVPGARARAEAGVARIRHRRHLVVVAAHRWCGPRDRRDECLAHRALRHSHERLERGAVRAVRRAARDPSRCARLCRGLRVDDARSVRRRDPDSRHRRRPAGGARRPGLLFARHDEGDLRHRHLRHSQHRRHRGRLEQPPALDHRVPARRQDGVRPRGRDLHCRRRGAMAA